MSPEVFKQKEEMGVQQFSMLLPCGCRRSSAEENHWPICNKSIEDNNKEEDDQ